MEDRGEIEEFSEPRKSEMRGRTCSTKAERLSSHQTPGSSEEIQQSQASFDLELQ